MAYSFKITKILVTEKFNREYKKLSADIQARVDIALVNLLKNPIPNSLRFEKLQGIKNPSVYTIHVTPNHSYKPIPNFRRNHMPCGIATQ